MLWYNFVSPRFCNACHTLRCSTKVDLRQAFVEQNLRWEQTECEAQLFVITYQWLVNSQHRQAMVVHNFISSHVQMSLLKVLIRWLIPSEHEVRYTTLKVSVPRINGQRNDFMHNGKRNWRDGLVSIQGYSSNELFNGSFMVSQSPIDDAHICQDLGRICNALRISLISARFETRRGSTSLRKDGVTSPNPPLHMLWWQHPRCRAQL